MNLSCTLRNSHTIFVTKDTSITGLPRIRKNTSVTVNFHKFSVPSNPLVFNRKETLLEIRRRGKSEFFIQESDFESYDNMGLAYVRLAIGVSKFKHSPNCLFLLNHR
ncbi:hypothetical protein S245_026737 [Arachis hypogaea]|nr:uncharacterized protein DS421_8g237300 [Arachis hypogaea]